MRIRKPIIPPKDDFDNEPFNNQSVTVSIRTGGPEAKDTRYYGWAIPIEGNGPNHSHIGTLIYVPSVLLESFTSGS